MFSKLISSCVCFCSVWFGCLVFPLLLVCGSFWLECSFSVFGVSVIRLVSSCLDSLFIFWCISSILRSVFSIVVHYFFFHHLFLIFSFLLFCIRPFYPSFHCFLFFLRPFSRSPFFLFPFFFTFFLFLSFPSYFFLSLIFFFFFLFHSLYDFIHFFRLLFSLLGTLICFHRQSLLHFSQLLRVLSHSSRYFLWAPQSTSCTATYHPLRKLSKLDEPDMQDAAGEVGTSS